MALLGKKRKLPAVSRATPEKKNNQSQKTRNQGMAKEYITQVSEGNEVRVIKKLSQEFSRTESRILGASSKLDQFLLNPQVRNCSLAVSGTSRKDNPENWEPTEDRSLDDPCPGVVLSVCHTSNQNDSRKRHVTETLLIETLFMERSIQNLGQN